MGLFTLLVDHELMTEFQWLKNSNSRLVFQSVIAVNDFNLNSFTFTTRKNMNNNISYVSYPFSHFLHFFLYFFSSTVLITKRLWAPKRTAPFSPGVAYFAFSVMDSDDVPHRDTGSVIHKQQVILNKRIQEIHGKYEMGNSWEIFQEVSEKQTAIKKTKIIQIWNTRVCRDKRLCQRATQFPWTNNSWSLSCVVYNPEVRFLIAFSHLLTVLHSTL